MLKLILIYIGNIALISALIFLTYFSYKKRLYLKREVKTSGYLLIVTVLVAVTVLAIFLLIDLLKVTPKYLNNEYTMLTGECEIDSSEGKNALLFIDFSTGESFHFDESWKYESEMKAYCEVTYYEGSDWFQTYKIYDEKGGTLLLHK